MKLKTPPSTALLTGLLAALAACGGGDGAAPTAPDGPAQPTQGPAPAPAPVPAPSPAPGPAPAPAPAPGPAAGVPTPVGVAAGLPVSATIGPAGGRLASPDGSLVIEVPPTAFQAPTTLSLQPISNHAHGGLGTAWRITPHGVTASQPITLRWRVADADAGAVAGLAVATQRADGRWVALRGAQHDPAARLLSVQTRHFSDWSLVAGLQLRAASSWVETGGRVGLSVQHCETVNVSADEAEIPLAACETWGGAGYDGFAWAANGVAGGNAQHGRVLRPEEFLFPGVAAYLAPATVPAANPVAISARYTAPPFGQGVTLVAQVRVVEPSSGCAWLQQEQALSAEFEARYAWSGSDGPWSLRIDHTAQVSGRLVRVPSQLPLLRWRGALGVGQVRVDDARTLGSGSAALVETDIGAGAPFLGDAPQEAPASVATLEVDLLSCQAWVGGEFHVSTQRRLAGLPSSTPTQGGAAFAIGRRDIGSQRFVAGQAAVPAVGLGDFADHYAPQGLNNALQLEQAGSAELRWLIKPAP